MDDRQLKKLAEAYVKLEGDALKKQNNPAWREATPRLDAIVNKGIGQGGARRALRWASLAAACLVMLAGAWMVSRINYNPGQAPQPVPTYNAAEQPAATSAPATTNADTAEPNDSVAATDNAAAKPSIELAFAMPVRFTVTGVEEDNGITVYTLADSLQDDVTLCVGRDALTNAGMNVLEIDGTVCYVKSCADYSVMSFNKDGITYRLSCRWDVNTLAGLAAAIL